MGFWGFGYLWILCLLWWRCSLRLGSLAKDWCLFRSRLCYQRVPRIGGRSVAKRRWRLVKSLSLNVGNNNNRLGFGTPVTLLCCSDSQVLWSWIKFCSRVGWLLDQAFTNSRRRLRLIRVYSQFAPFISWIMLRLCDLHLDLFNAALFRPTFLVRRMLLTVNALTLDYPRGTWVIRCFLKHWLFCWSLSLTLWKQNSVKLFLRWSCIYPWLIHVLIMLKWFMRLWKTFLVSLIILGFLHRCLFDHW